MKSSRPDLESRPALAPGVRLQADPVSGATVLLYPEGVLELNESAQAITAHCDGEWTVRDIVAALSAEYDIDESTLTGDALACLEDLLNRNLVVLK